jgi:hypothetical protein
VGDSRVNKDQAINEFLNLRQMWELEQENSTADGNSDYATYTGAINAIDIAIKIVKEIN